MSQEHIKELTDIRSMMERSSRFLSLSGFAGILAGIYALLGAALAYTLFKFNPNTLLVTEPPYRDSIMNLTGAYMLGLLVLCLSVGTAMLLSAKRARNRGEQSWNATSRRLLLHMAVPLMAGGILVLILTSKGAIGLVAPITLIFYGVALFSASKFTYDEIRLMGIVQMVLGLLGVMFIPSGLLFWVLGFGVTNIVFGIYIHFKYEREISD